MFVVENQNIIIMLCLILYNIIFLHIDIMYNRYHLLLVCLYHLLSMYMCSLSLRGIYMCPNPTFWVQMLIKSILTIWYRLEELFLKITVLNTERKYSY